MCVWLRTVGENEARWHVLKWDFVTHVLHREERPHLKSKTEPREQRLNCTAAEGEQESILQE